MNLDRWLFFSLYSIRHQPPIVAIVHTLSPFMLFLLLSRFSSSFFCVSVMLKVRHKEMKKEIHEKNQEWEWKTWLQLQSIWMWCGELERLTMNLKIFLSRRFCIKWYTARCYSIEKGMKWYVWMIPSNSSIFLL